MFFKQIDEIVNGTKTQTRRVCKPNEIGDRWQVDPTRYFDVHTLHNNESRRHLKWRVGRDYAVQPGRGKAGAWSDGEHWRIPTPLWTKRDFEIATQTGWQPLRVRLLSIHREKLQAISEADAVAEGYPHVGEWHNGMIGRLTENTPPSPIEWYRDLWQSINGPKSWDTTVDVWALTFVVVR